MAVRLLDEVDVAVDTQGEVPRGVAHGRLPLLPLERRGGFRVWGLGFRV